MVFKENIHLDLRQFGLIDKLVNRFHNQFQAKEFQGLPKQIVSEKMDVYCRYQFYEALNYKKANASMRH